MNRATGLQRETKTNEQGSFTIPLLQPSTYSITVRHEGFAPAEIQNVVLNVGDQKSLQIQLKAGNVTETVQVTDDAPLINESPAVGTVVDRQFVENLPLNGRSFQSLINLTPGVVPTSGSGQFSVNGQRSSSNYFTVDGVSANLGVLVNSSISAPGSTPGSAVTGGFNNLLSVDALQEFKILTSTFSPEFGRSPGGQVSLVTRSGTNDFHGTLFEYIRNDALDATDWFVNANRLRKPPLRQNDFGFVFGGPVLLPRFGEGGSQPWYDGKNRTFFFFSYEGLRLRVPVAGTVIVPSLGIRQSAPAAVRPLLNANPLPNGRDFGNGSAEFSFSESVPSVINATSFRIDHTISERLTLFGRYNYSPSSSEPLASQFNNPFNRNPRASNLQTLTLGATHSMTPRLSNEFLGNYSKSTGSSSFILTDLGGAVPVPDSIIFPNPFSSQDSFANYSLRIGTTTIGGFQFGSFVTNLPRQINIVDNVSFMSGSHQPKFGVDYRYLFPIARVNRYSQFLTINVSNSIATSAQIRASQPLSFSLTNVSLYGQDTWKITPRLTLTYGLRWELNTPPKGKHGNDLFTAQGVDNLATATVAPRGTPLFQTPYNNFAPRVGVAYQLTGAKGRETMLRGGFGVFYDLGIGELSQATASSPYTASRALTNQAYPLSAIVAAPLPFSLNPPYSLSAADSDFQLPYTLHWNVTIEQSVGVNQTLSAAYVAAAGRRLLRREVLFNPNPNISQLSLTRNKSTSDYNSLQVQFQRRMARGLQALASYTWAHSIDNSSSDGIVVTPLTTIDPSMDRGPSDFDVRHVFTAAMTYNLPAPTSGRVGTAILRNWSMDSILRAQTARPVNVIANNLLFFGNQLVFGDFRPDLVTGVPLYIDDPTAPGRRRFNRAAFITPLTPRQGTLGRNALRGFPLSQVDFVLRRHFNLTERVTLQLRAELFNIFNHPNFNDPVNILTSPQFGRSTSMARSGFGGLNQLYQLGGPRSVQLAVKLKF